MCVTHPSFQVNREPIWHVDHLETLFNLFVKLHFPQVFALTGLGGKQRECHIYSDFEVLGNNLNFHLIFGPENFVIVRILSLDLSAHKPSIIFFTGFQILYKHQLQEENQI